MSNNYIQADQQLHRLCQIIAKANRTYVHPKKDDSHTNLGFNPDRGHISGRWIETEQNKIRLILRLMDVCFVWLDEAGNNLQTVSTAKKHIDEIENQLRKTLKKEGLDSSKFQEPMHYEIPDYPFMGQSVALLSRLALNDWVYWRTIANEACDYLLKSFNQNEEIRIWPHHFDTGIYMDLNEKLGIGFGFAMKDDHVGAPYFYATCYPKEGEADYSEINELSYGRWVVDDWHGAVLSLKELQMTSKKEANDIIHTFIDETMNWYNAM